MSSNYLLEVAADEGRNLLTFTVRPRPSYFARVRVPVATVLTAWIVHKLWHVYELWLRDEKPTHGLIAHIVIAAIIGLVLFTLQEKSDSLMVMEDMGVQLCSRQRWRFSRSSIEFIPRSDIIDLVVNEGFHGYGQVIFYMCVLTKTQERAGNAIRVVFPNFLPRKDMILQVWRQSRKMLYGDTRRHFRHVPGHGLREVKLHD